ncbi:MAG TPA: hypothetical protein VFB62_16775 [Polyangiaceae bacterium]|nr:hypothetical protein [Polyangiaceae bacterium]
MQKYGIAVEQMSPSGQVAVQAAERLGVRTTIYRDRLPVAAIVPAADLEKLEAPELTDPAEDPLLSLCGTFSNDAFVDRAGDLERTGLFHRPASAPDKAVTRTGTTLKPPAPPRSRGRRT